MSNKKYGVIMNFNFYEEKKNLKGLFDNYFLKWFFIF